MMTEHAVPDGRTARRDRNRLAVLDAVLELLGEGDITPSPEAIALRSGVSLRSVYRYMSHIDDLAHAAIDRHLERVGPLFALEAIGEGAFHDRVERFVSARLRLCEAVAPVARAALARTRMRVAPASQILTESLNARRGLLRVQLSRHFAAELATFGAQGDAILAAADALTQIETIDWYLVDGGYTLDQTRDALVTGLHRLLGPGDTNRET
jgi:TetR/AcrR family transcriptional regulator, regulator of autoinduction and epiphytic fitness